MVAAHVDQGQVMASLQSRLEAAGISTAEWGKGEAKTLRHLAEEIAQGECELIDDQGKITRIFIVGGAKIFYAAPDGELFCLVEEKQVFTDGRERKRNLGYAVSEKMKPGEDPAEAMIRGIREELGVSGDLNITYEGQDELSVPSSSYPGLDSRCLRHRFAVLLSEQQYYPSGYVEQQSDKITYFVWERERK